jgi:hypothetical protein
MDQSKSLGRKAVDGIDPTKLTELALTDEDREDFKRGIRLFNEGRFWHAHEAWEQVWRRHPEDGRLFIQGLIQMAAAFHLLIDKKRYVGARSNFDKALTRLVLFEPTFLDLPVSDYVRVIEKAKDEIQRVQNGEAMTTDPSVVPIIAFLGTPRGS